jgi:hypothetical protein
MTKHRTTVFLETDILQAMRRVAKDDERPMAYHYEKALRAYGPIKKLISNEPQKELAPVKSPKSDKKEIIVPSGINESAWSEWAFFRAHKKKPLSHLSAKKQFKLLLNYSIEVQQNIIDSSINGGWTGLFEPKGNNNESSQSNTTGRPTKREQALSRVERDAAIIASMGSNPCRSDRAGMALDDQNVRQQVGHSVGADDDGGRESYPELRGVVQRD